MAVACWRADGETMRRFGLAATFAGGAVRVQLGTAVRADGRRAARRFVARQACSARGRRGEQRSGCGSEASARGQEQVGRSGVRHGRGGGCAAGARQGRKEERAERAGREKRGKEERGIEIRTGIAARGRPRAAPGTCARSGATCGSRLNRGGWIRMSGSGHSGIGRSGGKVWSEPSSTMKDFKNYN